MFKHRYTGQEVDAVRWEKIGDHPAVTALKETGKCMQCPAPKSEHGQVQSLMTVKAPGTRPDGSSNFEMRAMAVTVCPGEFIVSTGELHRVVPAALFLATHEES
jgi:hypothetical protein